MKHSKNFTELKSLIQKEKNIVKELLSSSNHFKNSEKEEKKMLLSHINLLKVNLRKTNDEIPEALNKIHLIKSLPTNNSSNLNSEKINSGNLQNQNIQNVNTLNFETALKKKIQKALQKMNLNLIFWKKKQLNV